MFYNTSITSIADTGRLGTKLRNVLVYWVFFCPVCASVVRGRTVLGIPGETRLGVGERRRGGEKRGKGER